MTSDLIKKTDNDRNGASQLIDHNRGKLSLSARFETKTAHKLQQKLELRKHMRYHAHT